MALPGQGAKDRSEMVRGTRLGCSVRRACCRAALQGTSCTVAADGDNGMGSGVLSKRHLGQRRGPSSFPPSTSHGHDTAGSRAQAAEPWHSQQQQGKGKASSGNCVPRTKSLLVAQCLQQHRAGMCL